MNNKTNRHTNSNKAWNRRGANKQTAYHIESIPLQKRFLIVCEGETEADYFNAFPVVSAQVEAVAKGRSRTALVEVARKMSAKYPEHEIWVVFDLDFYVDATNQSNYDCRDDFDEAVFLADAYQITVAYSNDAFELWFLLHFEQCNAAVLRQYFYERLSEIWKNDLRGKSYDSDKAGGKTAFFRQHNYYRLLPQQRKAIQRAKKLHEQHQLKHHLPSMQNPCTTVYQLVEALNQYLKR